MRTRRVVWLRYLAVIVALAGLALADDPATAAALPDCAGFCGETQDCDAWCLDETPTAVQCLNYNGGPGNGMCDGDSCWHYCDVWICQATCFSGGEETYCGAITQQC